MDTKVHAAAAARTTTQKSKCGYAPKVPGMKKLWNQKDWRDKSADRRWAESYCQNIVKKSRRF